MVERRNAVMKKRIGRTILGIGVLLYFLCAGCASKIWPPETADVPAGAAIAQKQITGIMVDGPRAAGEADRVVIRAGSELDFTSIRQDDPPGVILFFPETTLGDVAPRDTLESNAVASINTALSPDQTGARVEIILKREMAYEVLRSGTDLEVVLKPEAVPPIAMQDNANIDLARSVDTGPSVSDARDTASEERYAPLELKAPAQTATSGSPAVVNRIDFSSRDAGRSAMIIGTTLPVRYELTKFSDQALRLRLFNARLPEHRQHRPLITTRFESAIDRISPMPAADAENTTDIVIELREWVPYRPVQEDDVITLHFDPSTVEPRTAEAAALPDWQAALAAPPDQPRPVQPGGVSSAYAIPEPQPAGQPQTLSAFDPQQHYTGQKIALDFHKTDIKNVFRILQQISGKNYAVDKDVTGEVTIALEKPVPWDQVLALILRMNQLDSVEEGDIIRIARTATLQAEDKIRRDKLEAERQRQEQEIKLEPLETAYLTINYANAQTEIEPHLKDIVTADRGSLTIDTRNNQLILTDTRAVIIQAKEIIRKIDKVTPQVLIEARIVEVSENFGRELGVSWGVSGEDIYRSDLGGEYSYGVAMNTPFTSDALGNSSGTIGMNFTRLSAWGTPLVLDAALRAMEEQGKGKIVSAPKILTLNNKAATIEQGSEVPYQELSTEGVPTTAFAEAKLSLKVTPQITPDDRIALKVTTNKDEIVGYSPLNVPILSINKTESELLVDNGETIVIGGVIKTELIETETGFPLLKDIPMLGWLFKSKQTSTNKNELMIFLTPRIIQLEQRNLVQAE
jgi:type IV pilus assembly protein PilQ